MENDSINQLLVSGKKHYILGEFEVSLDFLAKACKQSAEKYGDMADECADAYILYGKALLECGRLDTNILNQEASHEDSTTEEEENENIIENGEITGETLKNPDICQKLSVSKNINGEIENGNDQLNVNDKLSHEESSEKLTNFQLAWEILDLARIIFSKKTDKESQLKLADTHLKLGELGLELENYEKAICDLIDCLEIQEKYLQPSDRRLAETHYNLSLAYSLLNNYTSASQSIQHAITTIQCRIDLLTQNPPDNNILEHKNEITELGEVLKDLLEKRNDYEECLKRPPALTSQLISQQFSTASNNTGNTCITKENSDVNFDDGKGELEKPDESGREADIENKRKIAQNISHLVKRKKNDE